MKLESLKDFQLNIIEKEKMSNFFGGNGRALEELAEAGKETGGGEVCATLVDNSTGGSCSTYTSDWDPGNNHGITFYGNSDNNKPC